jgi:prolyl-tRNA editing enzyme YbaK/EbsC (Cys-tRNA(Pro) deacylase)
MARRPRTRPSNPVTHGLDGIEHHAFLINPLLAGTDAFTAAYGWTLHHAVNAIVMIGRRAERAVTAMCLALASTRVDTNKTVPKTLDMRKMSFAPIDDVVAATGM